MIGGDEYLKVCQITYLKAEDATDEEIASSTGLRINMVRKVLYDLFGKGVNYWNHESKMKEKVGLSIDGELEEKKQNILLKIKRKKLKKDYNKDLTMKMLQTFIIVVMKTVQELHLKKHSMVCSNVHHVKMS